MSESTGGASEKVITAIVSVLVAILALAGLAVLVSKSANTSNVLTASSNGFAQALCTALSPLGVKCGSGLSEIINSTITYPGL
jgi:hypothetical protein